jgi:hypothetical protein
LSASNDLGAASQPLSYSKSFTFADGAGLNQAQQIFSDTRTLAASAAENLDLAGVLTNVFGSTLTFTKIKGLIICASDANTNDVVVGGHATAALAALFGDVTDTIKVKPGGMFALVAPAAAGYAVVATTGDMLTVTNSAGTTGVTYDIIILGATS